MAPSRCARSQYTPGTVDLPWDRGATQTLGCHGDYQDRGEELLMIYFLSNMNRGLYGFTMIGKPYSIDNPLAL